MRIAIVSPGYPPAPGGVENVVAHSARALARAGAQVEVLAQERRRNLPPVESVEGVTIRRFRCNRAETFRTAPALYRYLARHRGEYDVVNGHSYHALAGVLAALVVGADRRSGPPFVLTPHFHGTGHTSTRSLLHHVYTPFGRAAVAASQAVVCVSSAEAELFLKRFPRAVNKISVIPNAVDAGPIRAARPLPGQPLTVLSVGRLETYKRVDRLIEAFGRLPWNREPAPQLVIIGAGPDRARLEALAAHCAPAGRIRFLGRVEDGELHRWLRTAAVLCSLSEHEAYGLAPAEALVGGARLVLSDIPAHVQFSADGRVELVSCQDSVPHLADALRRAVDAPRPEIPAVVPGWDDIAARLLALYAGLQVGRPLVVPAEATA